MEQINWQNLSKKERRRLKKEQERLKQEQEARKKRLMKWGLIFVSAILLVGGTLFFRYFDQKRLKNAPKIEIAPASFDFGKVSLEEKVQTSFTIKNSGASSLRLSGAATSCDCTTAKLKVGEKESPVFGMHNPPNWSATLEVGETGELVVFYEPKVHPVLGPITREVYVFSNDPFEKEKKVTIYADVKR